MKIHHGDLFDVLPTLPEASIDACVTDGPYGIGFMGKKWDSFKPEISQKLFERGHAWTKKRPDNPNLNGRKRQPGTSPSAIEYDYSLNGLRGFQAFTEQWGREVFRVLKPGAYILSCGAPRAHHRMMCGLEDAGFVVRDCFAWLFGSGFPKSKNMGAGRGTALKPAHEPIALAWKPFKGSIAANLAKHGTGALNIDACRIAFTGPEDAAAAAAAAGQRLSDQAKGEGVYRAGFSDGPESADTYQAGIDNGLGRWPANVLIDEEAASLIDEQTGELGGGSFALNAEIARTAISTRAHNPRSPNRSESVCNYGDIGGASRFYYCAKPSRAERDFGCDDLPERSAGEATDRKDGTAGLRSPRAGAGRTGGARNIHPTVKPVSLMRWLVRLVTPPGGTVLDPFLGSGTTGMACRYEQFEFIGIEREAAYIEIAKRRIAAVAPLFAEVAS